MIRIAGLEMVDSVSNEAGSSNKRATLASTGINVMQEEPCGHNCEQGSGSSLCWWQIEHRTRIFFLFLSTPRPSGVAVTRPWRFVLRAQARARELAVISFRGHSRLPVASPPLFSGFRLNSHLLCLKL